MCTVIKTDLRRFENGVYVLVFIARVSSRRRCETEEQREGTIFAWDTSLVWCDVSRHVSDRVRM